MGNKSNKPKSVIRVYARLIFVSGRLTRTGLAVRTKSQELWHTIMVLISCLLLCLLPLRAEFTFYSLMGYANFRQCSDSVVYLSPTYLYVLSGHDVASFFIVSFFDMFPSFFLS